MKKSNENEEKMNVLNASNEKKGEIKRELDYCNSLLKEEYDKLYDYQVEYFCWINSRKDIVSSIKEDLLPCKNLKEIISFCDRRNYFLLQKLKMLRSSIAFIETTLANFDSIDDFIEVDSIDTTLRLIRTSLGKNIPTDVFGLPF